MQYSKSQILQISDCTSLFYKSVGDSFSQTRTFAWAGWDKCLPSISMLAQSKKNNHLNIVDIACGNLRFKKYIDAKLNNATYSMQCIDNSNDLMHKYVDYYSNIELINVDIIRALLNDNLIKNFNNADLIVAFGLMHHIPTFELRKKLIFDLYGKLNNGGLLIVSFWQFLTDEKLRKKAIEVTKQSKKHLNMNILEENDYFLSWQDNNEVFRFCHHFDNDEINKLFFDLDALDISQFSADGNNNKLNRYVLISK